MRSPWSDRASQLCGQVWARTLARLGEDWVFLALLGVSMAAISFAMDFTISAINKARLYLVQFLVPDLLWLQLLTWTGLSVLLILFSSGFIHITAPQAVGSGLPEMKVILRGVVLPEYLTIKVFLAKVVGLTATLGSGMPLGKLGPFVHICCSIASCMGKMITRFQGMYCNESRKTEMLAAACAVGLSRCLSSDQGRFLIFCLPRCCLLFWCSDRRRSLQYRGDQRLLCCQAGCVLSPQLPENDISLLDPSQH